MGFTYMCRKYMEIPEGIWVSLNIPGENHPTDQTDQVLRRPQVRV